MNHFITYFRLKTVSKMFLNQKLPVFQRTGPLQIYFRTFEATSTNGCPHIPSVYTSTSEKYELLVRDNFIEIERKNVRQDFSSSN